MWMVKGTFAVSHRRVNASARSVEDAVGRFLLHALLHLLFRLVGTSAIISCSFEAYIAAGP